MRRLLLVALSLAPLQRRLTHRLGVRRLRFLSAVLVGGAVTAVRRYTGRHLHPWRSGALDGGSHTDTTVRLDHGFVACAPLNAFPRGCDPDPEFQRLRSTLGLED